MGFEAVAPFCLTIPKGWEAYGASFDLLTEDDEQAGRDETLTVSGTVLTLTLTEARQTPLDCNRPLAELTALEGVDLLRGVQVRPATLTLVGGATAPRRWTLRIRQTGIPSSPIWS